MLPCLLGCSCIGIAAADPLEPWHWRHPLPPGNELRAVAFGMNQFVAVGDLTLLTSPNGADWTAHTSAQFQGLQALTTDGQLWVAAGTGGNVLLSPDARLWVPLATGIEADWRQARYGGGRFLVVGDAGRLMMSLDGFAWEDRSPSTPRGLRAVACGEGVFVALGEHHTILRSLDGWEWNTRIPISGTADLLALTFGQGLFVAVGEQGTILRSADGEYWRRCDSPTGSDLCAAIETGGMFVASGADGTTLHSTDGVTWTARVLPVADTVSGLANGASQFIGVGPLVTVVTSTDGQTWSAVGSLNKSRLAAVTYGLNRFVAVGDTGSILVSSTGESWIAAESPTAEALSEIAFAANRFVAVGKSGVVLSSPDGFQWQPHASGTTDWIRGVTFGGGRFVAITALGEACVSPDGTTWTQQSMGENLLLTAVTFGANPPVFVAVGPLQILRSTDGIQWEPAEKPFEEWLNSVTRGPDRFVAVGDEGGVYQSTDGMSWQRMGTLPAQPFRVAYGEDRFVVTSRAGPFSSTDAVTWLPHPAGTTRLMYGIGFGRQTVVLAGEVATLLQSDPLGTEPGALRLAHPVWSATQGAEFDVVAPANAAVRLEGSEDLEVWHILGEIDGSEPGQVFRDEAARTKPRHFYRAVIPSGTP
jgi:hypothetical protein